MAENTARNLLILGGLGVLGYWWYTSMGSAQAAEKRSTPSGGGTQPSLGPKASSSKASSTTVALLQPANGAAFKPGESVEFTIDVASPNPITSVEIEWVYNGKVVSRYKQFKVEGSTWGSIQSTGIDALPGSYLVRAIATDSKGAETYSAPVMITFARAGAEPKFAEDVTGEGEEGGLRGNGSTAASTTEGGKSSWGTPTGEVSTAQGRVQGVSFEDTSSYFALGPSDYSYNGGDYGMRG